MRVVFNSLLVLASIVLAYMCVRSIMDPIEFEGEKSVRDKAVIARLIDIRKAQIAHREAKGVYAEDFNKLMSFVNNEKIAMVSKKGELTDQQMEKGLTEDIALALVDTAEAAKYGIEDLEAFKENFRRDTSYVSVKESVFGVGYNIDSIAYVPFTNGEKFEMRTGFNKTKSGIKIPLFEACTPYKVYLNGLNKQEIINLTKKASALGKYEGLKVGDVEEPNNNAGNWE